YRDLEQTLPPVGSRVVTAKGRGRVVAQEILAQKLLVEFEDERRIIVGAGDIQGAVAPKGKRDSRPDPDEAHLSLADPEQDQSDDDPTGPFDEAGGGFVTD